MQMQNMAANDYQAGGDDNQSQTDGQGVVIEIKCKPDGTFEVAQESLEQESQEEQQFGESNGQEARSFGEALRMAAQIYQQSMSSTENDAAASAFKSARGGDNV